MKPQSSSHDSAHGAERTTLDSAIFARLARLELSPEERERYQKEFETLFSYFNQIRSVNTDGVEPMVYPTEQTLRFRADQTVPPPGREMLRNAPATEGGEFYRVPKVVES